MLTRRNLLRAAPVGLVGIATPVVAQYAPPALSPQERVVAAVEELKAALLAFDPSIRDWTLTPLPTEAAQGMACRFLLAAYNWQGNDGWIAPEDAS